MYSILPVHAVKRVGLQLRDALVGHEVNTDNYTAEFSASENTDKYYLLFEP